LVEITPRENGIHSLAEGLRAFDDFHSNPEHKFALKDAILGSHHGLETLFKHLLSQYNPLFLVEDDVKMSQIVQATEKSKADDKTDLYDVIRTIGLEETVIRLRKLGLMASVDEREYRAFVGDLEALTAQRNRLQHFKLNADEDALGRLLGNTVPRGVDLIDSTQEELKKLDDFFRGDGPVMKDLVLYYPSAPTTLDLLRSEYDRLVKDAVIFFKGKHFTVPLLLRVTDYGRVGASPYTPRFESTGFLEFKAEPHGSIWGQNPEYSAVLYTPEPEMKGPAPKVGFVETEVKGAMQLDGSFHFEGASAFLKLAGAEQHISVIKRFDADLKINVNYEGRAMMSSGSLDFRSLSKVEGTLNLTLHAFPRGYSEGEVLTAVYNSPVNHKNAPFSIHAFTSPPRTFSEGRYLEWRIEVMGELTFI
jgi:hypothetical protein